MQNPRGFNPSSAQPPSQTNPNYPPNFPKTGAPNIPTSYGSNITPGTQPNMMNPMPSLPGNPNVQTYSPVQNRQFPPNVSPGSKYYPSPGGNPPPYNPSGPIGSAVPSQGLGNEPQGGTSAEKKTEEAKKAGGFGLLDTLQDLLAQKAAPKEAQTQAQAQLPKGEEPKKVIEEVKRKNVG